MIIFFDNRTKQIIRILDNGKKEIYRSIRKINIDNVSNEDIEMIKKANKDGDNLTIKDNKIVIDEDIKKNIKNLKDKYEKLQNKKEI